MNRRQLTFGLVSLAVCGEYTFGHNVPSRIVKSYFDKARGKTVRLAGRITFTYPEFKRFNVATEYRIEPR
jgi:hypothetical protein